MSDTIPVPVELLEKLRDAVHVWRHMAGIGDFVSPIDALLAAHRQEAERVADCDAANEFRNSLLARADVLHPYPLWHGWAIYEAYLAGLMAARDERRAKEKS